ncbi:MAG: hypothetical protein CMC77_01165 [Flavobacteriaceae bacterium]|nr:hypothetical protein [Flavobacteriaceae bacterium]
MFSRGQLIFGILFAIVFIIIIILAYKKDKELHQKYYSGVLWILMTFIAFIAGIAAIKFLLGY